MNKLLTRKQNCFLIEFINNGGNKVQAALKVYDTTNYKTASKIADNNFKNHYIRKRIEEILAKNNINESTIGEKVAEGLEAQIVARNELTKSYERLEFPDHNIRYKYLIIATELLGLRNR